jgi:hypothetical protein
MSDEQVSGSPPMAWTPTLVFGSANLVIPTYLCVDWRVSRVSGATNRAPRTLHERPAAEPSKADWLRDWRQDRRAAAASALYPPLLQETSASVLAREALRYCAAGRGPASREGFR